MQIPFFALALLWQFSSLGSATPLSLTPRASVPSCLILPPTDTSPSCSGGNCCAWKYETDRLQTGDCRGTTTTTSPAPVAVAVADNDWKASCEVLRQSVLADHGTLVFLSWTGATWYRLVAHAGCSFDVRPDTGLDSSHEGIHLGNGDIADILSAALAVAAPEGRGAAAVAGSTTCYGYPMQWRMVPTSN